MIILHTKIIDIWSVLLQLFADVTAVYFLTCSVEVEIVYTTRNLI